MKPSKKAVAILRKVKRAILRNPNAYRQDEWHCGTACCIAGHVCLAAGASPVTTDGRDFKPKVNGRIRHADDAWEAMAARALGLPYPNPDPSAAFAHNMFSPTGRSWPEPFSSEWDAANNMADEENARVVKAKIAARRIEHFIATGE